MSIWNDEYKFNREVNEAAGATISNWIRDSRSAWMVVIITITAEIMAVVIASVAGDKIDEFLADGNSEFFLLGIPFVIGTMFTAAAYRLLQIKLLSIRDPLFRSEWTLWFVAIIGGVANATALYVLYSVS